MSEPTPEASSTEKQPRRGVSMPVGIAAAVVMAALTCAVGLALLGRRAPAPPEPVPAPQPPPIAEAVDAGQDRDGAVDGDAGGDGPSDASSDHAVAAESEPAPPAPTPAAAPAGAAAESDDCSLPDKDIAREAWRRNLPTICHSAGSKKSTMYVPLRGSIDDATYGVRRRPAREARVDLPEAESLLTMAQYKLDRDGFVDLKPTTSGSGGALLRIRLQRGASDPVFELKDGYVKITVALPK